MLAQLFLLIEVLMRAFNLWDQFGQYMDDKRERDRVERDQKRSAAIDKQKTAESEADFDKAQDDIANNLPRP